MRSFSATSNLRLLKDIFLVGARSNKSVFRSERVPKELKKCLKQGLYYLLTICLGQKNSLSSA